jgi:dipeptidyl aminopeptidase/acylaminoacyl peptidase
MNFKPFSSVYRTQLFANFHVFAAVTAIAISSMGTSLMAQDSAGPVAATADVQNAKDAAKSPVETRMTPELLLKLGRLGQASLSPNGNQIAYTVRRYDLAENKGRSSLHVVNLADSKDNVSISDWSSIGSLDWVKTPAGDRLFFEGTPKKKDGATEDPTNQAYMLDVVAGAVQRLTDFEDGISNLKVAAGGAKIAFTRDIKMDKKASEIYEDLPETEGRIIDTLMYRHWKSWHDYKYSHVHVASIGSDGKASDPIDLMTGIKADAPVPPFGGGEQFSWSPDGSEIALTMKNVKDWAQSTNSDVYLVDLASEPNAADAMANLKNITENGLGYDNNPVYSPDGKWIAFNSMQRASFESDRNRIILFERETGVSRELTVGLDQNANNIQWAPDSKSIVFESERDGTNQLFQIQVEDGQLKQVSQGRFNWHTLGFINDSTLLTTQTSMLRPAELHQLSLSDGVDKKITAINDEIFENLKLPKIEERFVEATDGKKIQCWVIHPPEFDAAADKKWPMLTYCQGGPQGQIGQWFSYRWNFHLMAAQGYVVLAPNRRGLPGFGREWNDQISGDWGGQAMKDILSTTDNMLAEPYIDKKRVGAVGASFGGYTVYWLMGNHGDRFQTMIAHCGVYNLESMYGSTEELFFVNHDLGGPYWSNPEVFEKYQRFSPHRFAQNWKTPLMVIHNELDFRVPVTQGMEAFTAAQVQGVPSRFLYFPDEGHWVQKPQNGVLWHRVFFEWLGRYCKPDTDKK